MNKGLVTARGGLKLRKSPKTGAVLRALRKGSKVEIMEEETWLRVKASDGKVGYVLADHIEKDASNLVDHSDLVAANDITDVASLADQEQDQCDIKIYANSQFIGKEMRVDTDDNLIHRNPLRWDAKLASR